MSILQLSNTTFRPSPLEPNVVHTLESLRQVIVQASANISETNSTLTKRIQWLQDDQIKDHVSRLRTFKSMVPCQLVYDSPD